VRPTSDRKIRANRANARASTGPKTAQGRIRSARNALRHALSLPIYSDPALSEEVEALAREIAGLDANAEMQELARRVAEAQIDLRRVRIARHDLLTRALGDPDYDSPAAIRKKSKLAVQLAHLKDRPPLLQICRGWCSRGRSTISWKAVGVNFKTAMLALIAVQKYTTIDRR
jgi:hypothetical protein